MSVWDQVAPIQRSLDLLKSEETLSCNDVASEALITQCLLWLIQILKKKMSGHPADEIDIVLRQFNLMKTDWEVTACRSKVYSTALRK